MDPGRSRSMWRLLESIHAVTYFAPQSIDALRATGLKGFWMCYFAGRAAPMGEVPAAVVEATFFNFSDRLVRRAIPDAWGFAAPPVVVTARWRGAAAALAPHAAVAGPKNIERAASLLSDATAALNCDGRTLGAANLSLDKPDDELAALWQLATTVREHRGDGHVAALVSAGLTGLEAHVTLVGVGVISREVLQGARGFTDEEWDNGVAALTERGMLREDGSLSDDGRAVRREVEAATDRTSMQPWDTLGDERCDEVARLLAPVARSIADHAVIPVLNPIGLPTT